MKKRIKMHMKQVEEYLETQDGQLDWDWILTDHLQQIRFYQHERLIHLLVLMLVSILAMMSFAIATIAHYYVVYAVTVLFIVVLLPYILHYFFLENSVQSMYQQYDRILERKKRDLQ